MLHQSAAWVSSPTATLAACAIYDADDNTITLKRLPCDQKRKKIYAVGLPKNAPLA